MTLIDFTDFPSLLLGPFTWQDAFQLKLVYSFYRYRAHIRQGPVLPVAHFRSPSYTSYKCRVQVLIQPAYGAEGSDPKDLSSDISPSPYLPATITYI